jgi:hypothetical protein
MTRKFNVTAVECFQCHATVSGLALKSEIRRKLASLGWDVAIPLFAMHAPAIRPEE